MKFTIDRSKWRCGGNGLTTKRGLSGTELQNSAGFMCCLGQVSVQLGCTNIVGIGEPCDIPVEDRVKLVDVLVTPCLSDTHLVNKAIDINDSERYDDATRESLLTLAFRENGHDVEFVGEYVK